MKSLRTLLGDRVSGGVLAAVSGWLLVVQLFVTALACGMSVPAFAGPSFVLCEPAAAPFEADGGGQGEAALPHDCPYVIAHDDDGMLGAEWAPGADLGPAFARAAEPAVRPAAEAPAHPIDPGRLGLAPSPRGPPILSA